MIIREYLYVDVTAVRGILAQVDSGVAERETETESREKKSGGGFKGFAEHLQSWGGNTTTEKSLGDALFPRLEEALEAYELLEDVSDLIATSTAWRDGKIQSALPPGKIIRLTSPGHLIDARFVAAILAGFAVTYRGLVNMGVIQDEAPTPPSTAGRGKGAKPQQKRNRHDPLPGEDGNLEGSIPLGTIAVGGTAPISGEFLRGITQVARGMFAPGLHLALTPEVAESGTIMLRLQEGRQYLDSDPDVLFARYGVGAQEWTVVGTVGHHPLPDPDMDTHDFMSASGAVRRGDFGRYVNNLGTLLGNLGFTDLPQAPGFSVVPWAVYRTIGAPQEESGVADAAAT